MLPIVKNSTRTERVRLHRVANKTRCRNVDEYIGDKQDVDISLFKIWISNFESDTFITVRYCFLVKLTV